MLTLKDLAQVKALEEIPMSLIHEVVDTYHVRRQPVDPKTIDNEKLFKNTAWIVWRAIKRIAKGNFVSNPDLHTVRIGRDANGLFSIRIVDLNLQTKYTIDVGTLEDKKRGDGVCHFVLRDATGAVLGEETTWPNFAKKFLVKGETPLAEAATPAK